MPTTRPQVPGHPFLFSVPPVGIHLFQNFLKSEFSEENILFWKACQTFKSQEQTPEESLQAKAQEIFAEYISMSPSAPNSVSIVAVQRDNVAHQY